MESISAGPPDIGDNKMPMPLGITGVTPTPPDELKNAPLKAEHEFDVIKKDRLRNLLLSEEEDRKLKSSWSKHILIWIYALIGSQIIGMLVLGYTNFSERFNQIVLAFYVQTFLQVVGLALIVVMYLFPKKNNDRAKPKPKDKK
jgi:hypothetical protein